MASALHSRAMLIVSLVFIFVTWLFVGLRFFTRAVLVKALKADDWWTLAATIFFTGFCASVARLATLEIEHGVTNLESVSMDTLKALINTILADFALYIWTAIVFKISLAYFFLRVVAIPWQRKVIIGTVTAYAIYSFAFFWVSLFQCGSPNNFFEGQITQTCLSYKKYLGPMNYAQSVFNAVTDWTFAVLPAMMVWGAQMKRSARIIVICILCLGILGSICSVIRIAFTESVGTPDVLVSAPDYAMLSIAELGVGISAASMATLRPLFSRMVGHSYDIYSNTRGNTRPTGQRSLATNDTNRRTFTGTQMGEGDKRMGVTITTDVELGEIDNDQVPLTRKDGVRVYREINVVNSAAPR